MFGELAAYQAATRRPTALFLDTSVLFAYFHPGVAEHDEARSFFARVGHNEIPYRPLYTSTYVVDELVTLLRATGKHEYAVTALSRTLDSDSITVISESDDTLDRARERIETDDGPDLSFTDEVSVVQMRERGVSHVLAFDGDFAALGFEQIPR